MQFTSSHPVAKVVEHLPEVARPGQRFWVVVTQVLPVARHDAFDQELGLAEMAPVLQIGRRLLKESLALLGLDAKSPAVVGRNQDMW